MRGRRGVVSVTVTALAAVLLSGCGKPTERPLRPEQVTAFDELYAANCVGCHGVDGRRGVVSPLNDSAYLAFVSDRYLGEVIGRGVPGTPMPAFARAAGGTLTDGQVHALVDGMKHRWGRVSGSAERIEPTIDAPDPDRGHRAFGAFCARCHGADGRGASAGSVVDAAFLSLTSNQAMTTSIYAGHVEYGIRSTREYAPGQSVTPQEIADMVAWLATHRGHHE